VPLRIYDRMTRSKRDFVPVQPGKVGMYVCGMTVQDRPHVGHIRSALSGDLMRRWLVHRGYEVTFVYNFTDVDDKIIARANDQGTEYQTVSERNIQAFLDVSTAHNLLPATHYPRATRHIAEMHAMIARLIETGHAYAAGGDVYFRVRSKADYGKLSGRDVDELRAGFRIEPGEAKEDAVDFALWKGSKPGEPAWESPWGPGRPGWHIECSAMAMKYLGETFDIHGGGEDLVFPHHENEIAQSEAFSGKPFANYWAENGLLNLGGAKMSKSTGILFYAADILERFEPGVVRYYLLASGHYASPVDFNEERLAEAGVTYDRLRATLERASAWEPGSGEPGGELATAVEDATRGFEEAMDDDFNSAGAIGFLNPLATAINRALDAGLTADAQAASRKLLGLGEILGLFWEGARVSEQAPADVRALVDAREDARKVRDWALADQLRKQVLDAGWVIEDVRGEAPRLKRA
jgi:cysteinyl-tRNA synthetase